MSRKIDPSKIDLTVEGLESIEGGVRLLWSATIGFGTYDIFLQDGKIVADSETMDSNDDKEFLKQLFSSLLDEVTILS